MIEKIWRRVEAVATAVSQCCCATVCIAIAAQIFCRFFLGKSLTWSEEMAQIALISMVFLALAEVERNNEHLQLEILFSIFPKLTLPLQTIGRALTILYGGIILYSGALMMPAVRLTRAKASGFPIRVVYYIMLAGVALWMVRCLLNMVAAFKKEGGTKA